VSKGQEIWDRVKGDYPFHAMAAVSVKPHLVTDCGEHASVLARTGWRIWGFSTASDRDKFVVQYGGVLQ